MFENLKKLLIFCYRIFKKIKKIIHNFNQKKILLRTKFFFYWLIKKKLIHKKNHYKILLDPLDVRSTLVIENKQDPKIKLFKILTKKYSYFIDAGSNYGEFSITLNKNYNKIFAIEPNYKVNIKFKESLSINKIKNIKLIQKALIHQNKKNLLFLTEKSNSGRSKIVYKKFNKKLLTSFNKSIVNCISCKELLNTYVKKESSLAIKIDVEGYDMMLLFNFLTHLRKRKNKIFIMIEIGPIYKTKEGRICLKKNILKILFNNFNVYQYRNEDCRKKNLRVFQISKKNIDIVEPASELLITNKKIKNHKINLLK